MAVGTAGTPRPLGGAIDQAAYRILQEALTNASRHGTGTASIDLAYSDQALEITVANPIPDDGSTGRNGGHGLIGMRERASLVGGILEEDQANGAFRIRAQLTYGHRQ